MERIINRMPEIILVVVCLLACALLFAGAGCTKVKGGSATRDSLTTNSVGGESSTSLRIARVEITPGGGVLISTNDGSTATTQPTQHTEREFIATTQSSIESPNSNINIKDAGEGMIGGVNIKPVVDTFKSARFVGGILIAVGLCMCFVPFVKNVTGGIIVAAIGGAVLIFPAFVGMLAIIGLLAGIGFVLWDNYKNTKAGVQVTKGVQRLLRTVDPEEADSLKETMAVEHDVDTKRKIDKWKRA